MFSEAAAQRAGFSQNGAAGRDGGSDFKEL